MRPRSPILACSTSTQRADFEFAPEAGGGAATTQPGAYTAGVDDRATLMQARSMLMLLLATCKQTEIALEAAANALDTDLTSDLSVMIERTEAELAALIGKIEALPD